MNYGLPYQGSKNGIAEWVVGQLPAAETFVDLFLRRLRNYTRGNAQR